MLQRIIILGVYSLSLIVLVGHHSFEVYASQDKEHSHKSHLCNSDYCHQPSRSDICEKIQKENIKITTDFYTFSCLIFMKPNLWEKTIDVCIVDRNITERCLLSHQQLPRAHIGD
jgi:hypothetical protein